MTKPAQANVLFGVFVGGRARRMGGRAKGLIPSPEGPPIIERATARCRAARPGAPIVLVGVNAAYGALGYEQLADDPVGIGPLGGLRALLRAGAARGTDVVALACDMPFLDERLLLRLLNEHQAAAACAPSVDGRWEPLFARYRPCAALEVVDALLAEGRHALHGVLVRLDAASLVLSSDERRSLCDWDSPTDVSSTS